MASEVDVCNMALSTLGSATTVTAISPPDGSAAAAQCATFYALARQEALDTATAWSFAKRRAALAALTVNPSAAWRYAYALPSDCATPVRVLALTVAQDYNDNWLPSNVWADPTESGGANFTLETDATQKVLLTNEPDAVLLYLVDQTDPTYWSAGFTSAMSVLLASYIAGPVIRGLTGAKTKAQLYALAMRMLAAAAANDANSSGSEQVDHVGASIRARA